jgi:hypothetical protein
MGLVVEDARADIDAYAFLMAPCRAGLAANLAAKRVMAAEGI